MKAVVVKRILYGALALGIMTVIFISSAQTSVTSAAASGRFTAFIQRIFFKSWEEYSEADFEKALYALHFLIRKVAHFSIFLLLAVSVLGFLSTLPMKWSVRILAAIAFTALYAVFDEFHQSFTAGRSMMVFDMLVDSAGGVLGALSMTGILLSLGKHPKTEEKL